MQGNQRVDARNFLFIEDFQLKKKKKVEKG